MDLINKFRSLDAYPTINEDFYNKTLSSGLITLTSSIVMHLIFIFELTLVENLTSKVKAWEIEKGIPFLYDKAPFLCTLEGYAVMRQEKEEEKRRFRAQGRSRQLCLTVSYYVSQNQSINSGGFSSPSHIHPTVAETAQASLHAERANSRALIFNEEDFKSLQLQYEPADF